MNDAAPPRPAVLVVEDEGLIAMLLEDALAEAGYRSAWSPDGSADAGEAAAAVVDICLAAGLDGRDVVRQLRRTHPGLLVVVITGYHPEDPQADLRGLGGPTLRLLKPFDRDRLAACVKAFVEAGSVPDVPPPRRRRADAPAEVAR